jgi:hypothetical protein
LSSEDDQCRDVYAHYGVAAFFAQAFEKNLINFLLIHARATNSQFTRQEFDDLEAYLHKKKTLGQLLKDIGAVVTYDKESESLISTALDRRNFLMHHYFWEKANEFMTSSGCACMFAELTAVRELFQRANDLAVCLCQAGAKAANIPWSEIEADFERRLKELQSSSDAEPGAAPDPARM